MSAVVKTSIFPPQKCWVLKSKLGRVADVKKTNDCSLKRVGLW